MSSFYHQPQFAQASVQNPPHNGSINNNASFPTFQNVSPEMINFGLNAGQDIINKQKDKWMPGVSGFWASLKYYFAVNNNYVKAKLLLVLYPLSNTSWQRLSADDFDRQESEQISRKWALPKQDLNAPDLYIPLMSFVTYVLLYGLSKGLGSATFSPDIIIQAIWRCLLLLLVESCLIKFGTNLLSVPLPFLDILAYSGYKFVPLCVGAFVKMINGTLGFLTVLITASMLAYFILKSMAAVVPPSGSGSQESSRLLILPGIGGSQLIMVLILSLF